MSNGTETYTDSNGEKWGINRSGCSMAPAWEFAHSEYDGPEDGRNGYGESFQECVQQIEEMIEE